MTSTQFSIHQTAISCILMKRCIQIWKKIWCRIDMTWSKASWEYPRFISGRVPSHYHHHRIILIFSTNPIHLDITIQFLHNVEQYWSEVFCQGVGSIHRYFLWHATNVTAKRGGKRVITGKTDKLAIIYII